MTATALVSGRLFRDPERKTSKAGKPFVTATIKDGDGDTVVWWQVLCFVEAGCEELASLRNGDGIAVSGGFKVDLFERNGQQRLSHTIFADRVISAKRQKRERTAERQTERSRPAVQSASGPDDEIPF